jgi:hypothetical protein
MSYGTNHGAQWQRGAEIVDLILKGAKPVHTWPKADILIAWANVRFRV